MTDTHQAVVDQRSETPPLGTGIERCPICGGTPESVHVTGVHARLGQGCGRALDRQTLTAYFVFGAEGDYGLLVGTPLVDWWPEPRLVLPQPHPVTRPPSWSPAPESQSVATFPEREQAVIRHLQRDDPLDMIEGLEAVSDAAPLLNPFHRETIDRERYQRVRSGIPPGTVVGPGVVVTPTPELLRDRLFTPDETTSQGSLANFG